MKKIALALALVIAGSLVSVAPASAGSWCNNGTYSSNSGRGACSWNGGVDTSRPSYSDPGSSSWNRQTNQFPTYKRTPVCYVTKNFLGQPRRICN
jgi:hypothetical protein